MTRRQRPNGTLSVDTELAWRAIDVMSLDLGKVVGDVIEKVDLMGADRVEERLACGSCEHLAVRLCVVGCRRHSAQIRTAFDGLDGDTSELAIGHRDAVAHHCRAHRLNVIRTDLVTEASRSAMDHYADLT
jgi:hypothetical protein